MKNGGKISVWLARLMDVHIHDRNNRAGLNSSFNQNFTLINSWDLAIGPLYVIIGFSLRHGLTVL